jgi:hypothetical protein
MAIVPSIAVSQSAISPQNITLTDDSTGTDSNIASRRIYIRNADGEALVPTGTTTDYITWSYSQSTKTVDVLTQDTAASIIVQWLDAGNAILYVYDNTYPLSEFGKQFFYYLVQQLGLSPNVFQDSNYAGNLSLFWAFIKAGDNAVTYGNDIFAGQQCYNKEIDMMQNQAKFF